MHRSTWNRKVELSLKGLGWLEANSALTEQSLGKHIGYLGTNVGFLIECSLFLAN